jgi:hypothetical protein
LLIQNSEGETDVHHPSHRHMLQDPTQQGQQDSIHPGFKVIEALSATTQGTTKEVDNITSAGGHIASSWGPKGECLPFSSNYVTFDAYQRTTKSMVNGKSSKPSSTDYWYLQFAFLTDCTSERATHIFGRVFGSAEKLVIDTDLNSGSFGGTYPNCTILSETCDVICVNTTSTDDAGDDDQVYTSCSYSTNCTTVNEFTENATVGITWKAIAPAVNTSITAHISAKQYQNVDSIVSQQRLAAAKLSVKVGGISINFPRPPNFPKGAI